jgi:prepilin peptidase CpaA
MSVLCTAFGFALLFPMLAIRGVGEGDVKMQMGFGAWVGAYFGTGATTNTEALQLGVVTGTGAVFWAFVFGAITGGVFGLAMILMRRKWGANKSMLQEIGKDLKMFASGQVGEATKRAEERRKVWVKLPYGIPLCVGFLMYLWLALVVMA